MIPVILGPKQRNYVIDHHHLALALHDEGVKEVRRDRHRQFEPSSSRTRSGPSWITAPGCIRSMPRASAGTTRISPNRVTDLVDDPFRSLAGELRRAGGFAKDTTPFSEFLWADFLRRRMKRKLVERDFDRALEKAMALAKSKDADYLPGWCGPAPED